MNTLDPANPWSAPLTTPSTTTVESILRYPARSHDYRRHLADYEATRIEPGADPRAEWMDPNTPMFYAWGEGVVMFETVEPSPRVWSIQYTLSPLDGLTLSGPHRYVPQDVRRWRDPAHRAKLKRRAREYAALLPGAR